MSDADQYPERQQRADQYPERERRADQYPERERRADQYPERERRAKRAAAPDGIEPVADAPGSERPVADASGSVPLAYLITFRTYGTWLHGDDRGSVDREHNVFGTPLLPTNPRRERAARQRGKHAPITLNAAQRQVARAAIVAVCAHRQWSLHELNVRSNHVHVVVSAPRHPDHVMGSFKSWATRRMREASVIDADIQPWAERGSRKYLWKPEQVEAACRYVLDGQGPDL
ncbi:MAG: transposase [Phycisphaerae bacterium]|nr:transposase [Phycisphaerae bacterium]